MIITNYLLSNTNRNVSMSEQCPSFVSIAALLIVFFSFIRRSVRQAIPLVRHQLPNAVVKEAIGFEFCIFGHGRHYFHASPTSRVSNSRQVHQHQLTAKALHQSPPPLQEPIGSSPLPQSLPSPYLSFDLGNLVIRVPVPASRLA
jgi:hypothetical protein